MISLIGWEDWEDWEDLGTGWDDLATEVLERLAGFLYPGETLTFALTCRSNLSAVCAVHGGAVPPMKSKYLVLAARSGRLEMVKWMRAFQPPCPCIFEHCFVIARGEAVLVYFQMGLELVNKCDTAAMSKAEEADTVALIGRGADVNTENSIACGQIKHNTSLMAAARHGHSRIATVLVDKGADVHAKTSNGWTALHYASSEGHAGIAAMLLENSADVQAKTNGGYTSLLLACHRGHGALATMLLDKGGADVQTKNRHGETPLQWARRRGQTEIVAVLLDKGAAN